MLRRVLQRAAALQLQACGAAASGGAAAAAGAALPSLAAAIQRLAPQQPAWPAAQLGAARQFAAGSGGGGEPPATAAAASSSQPEQAAEQVLRSHSGSQQFSNMGEALEAWGKAMDEGDWGGAWDIFEGVLPVDGPEFPPLEALLEYDEDEEAKAGRREREAQIREAHAARWVRRVDPATGRAHGVGKRKTSVALVWLKQGSGQLLVNRRPYDAYFPDLLRRNDVLAPFLATGTLGGWDVMVRVRGGGQTGQSQATRHGIARALQAWDPALRPALKAAGLLTRDSRIVERKKPGLKKARKAFQWVKR